MFADFLSPGATSAFLFSDSHLVVTKFAKLPNMNSFGGSNSPVSSPPQQSSVFEPTGMFSPLTPLGLTNMMGGEEIPNDPGKMFIGGLSWQTTPESVREYFSQFGDVAEVMVMKDPATRRSRGFGFITFSNAGSVNKVQSYPAHQLDGKLIEPKVNLRILVTAQCFSICIFRLLFLENPTPNLS